MLTRSPHPDPMLSNSPATLLEGEGERGPSLLADSTFPSAGFEYAYVAADLVGRLCAKEALQPQVWTSACGSDSSVKSHYF